MTYSTWFPMAPGRRMAAGLSSGVGVCCTTAAGLSSGISISMAMAGAGLGSRVEIAAVGLSGGVSRGVPKTRSGGILCTFAMPWGLLGNGGGGPGGGSGSGPETGAAAAPAAATIIPAAPPASVAA